MASVTELAELMELERIRMWRQVSPSLNLHDTSCGVDCLNPSHYPDGDPLDQEE